MAETAKDSVKIVANNRRALHLYHVLERHEAGVMLLGSEVKAIREGRVQLREAYANIRDGELFLYDCHIGAYSHTGYTTHEPMRPRKLLMHRQEIKRLLGKLTLKGLTLVPLKLYLKRGKVKVELGLGRGKKVADKRDTLRRRDAEREVQSALKKKGAGIRD